jgi:hypothetical protein
MRTITIDTALWGLLVGTVLPIVVALVTNQLASSRFKALTLLFLSALTTIGQEIVAAGQFEVKETILKFALLFLTSIGIHYGLLKPAGITGQNGVVQENLTKGLKSD